MIRLDLTSLIDNTSEPENEHPKQLAKQYENCLVGYVSIDTNWNDDGFTDNDGCMYYVFVLNDYGENFKDCNHDHRYAVHMFGAQEGDVYIRRFHTIEQFYQWIQLYEFRDFTAQDMKDYVDDIV